jgi:hypothetical protein
MSKIEDTFGNNFRICLTYKDDDKSLNIDLNEKKIIQTKESLIRIYRTINELIGLDIKYTKKN